MDANAFEVAQARALALCRAAATEPIPVDDALAHLEELLKERTDWARGSARHEELLALERVFRAVAAIQEIGAALPGGSSRTEKIGEAIDTLRGFAFEAIGFEAEAAVHALCDEAQVELAVLQTGAAGAPPPATVVIFPQSSSASGPAVLSVPSRPRS